MNCRLCRCVPILRGTRVVAGKETRFFSQDFSSSAAGQFSKAKCSQIAQWIRRKNR
jgi:hypothetical protein